jgi:hypothetical protein
MKIKNITLLVVVLSLIYLLTGCFADSTEIPTDTPTGSIEEHPTTVPNITEPNENDENVENTTTPTVDEKPNVNVDKIEPQFIEYDEKYLSLKTLWSNVSATIIPFPSTKISSETFMEEFYTEEEFKTYLDEYSDLLGHKNDKIVINDEGFVYQHSFSTYATKGYVPRFFLLSSPQFQPLYRIDVEEIKYDKETKSVYIIIVIDDCKHSVYAVGEAMQENIDTNTQATYGILYLDIDDEFKEDVEHLYFVLPK